MSDTEDEPSSQDIIEEEVGDEMEVVDAKEAEGGENEERKASGSESSEESDDEDEEYEVESILQSRFVKKKKQYLVKWVNYSDEWNTWEPMENLEGSQDLVQAFEIKEEEKLQKEESEKAAANERKRQAKVEREAKRREREAEKEAKRAKKEAEKPKSDAKPKIDSKRKSRAIISSSDSDDDAEDEKKPTEKPKIEKKKTQTEAERRKKERKQEAKKKALKEKNDFRRMELDAERRKNMTNAYKNPGVGKDDIRAPTPEVPPEIQRFSKAVLFKTCLWVGSA